MKQLPKENKICQACGREMEYRKKWEKSWDEVKYCSKACQRLKVPEKFMQDILEFLSLRDPASSICPSDILKPEDKKNKDKMERVRSAGRLLAYEGKISITQKGKEVDPQNFKGPIRFKLKKL